MAELGPVRAGRPLTELPELLASPPRLSETEAEDFARDLVRATSELSAQPAADRWES
ncbi:MAG: hypothetical protein HY704_01690 [Gemmatimonadetes bacterium]|nr:hypothetical protein [Gemmatimonadota bacterium]